MVQVDETLGFVGCTVEQVRCEAPEFQKFVGRKGKVVEEMVGDDGEVHLLTDDDIWCPARLVKVV